jgi:glycosyltransferase involved in cell wall biosynthesis
MQLIKLPTVANKYLDTIIHSFLSSLHALSQRFDIALYFIAGNSPVTWIPRLVGTKTILNVDGLDWKRQKWPLFAKQYIKLSEYLATILPNAYLTDSRVVQAYYRDKFKNEPPIIPYGSEVEVKPPGKVLAKFGLERGKYILFVGRLVPENYVHHLIGAYRELNSNLKCVIVGDAPYAESYIAELKTMANTDPRIIFTGYVFGEGYYELGSNAYIFVETSGVGGTHPALVEAMAFGNCVVAHNTPENLETVGEAGFGYDGKVGSASLAQVLMDLIADPDKVTKYRKLAQERALSHYSWDRVTDQYEELFYKILGHPPKKI